MLGVIMLSVIMLSVIMLTVIMLNVRMLCAVMLSVVAPRNLVSSPNYFRQFFFVIFSAKKVSVFNNKLLTSFDFVKIRNF